MEFERGEILVQLWRDFGELVPLFLVVALIIGIIAYILGRKKKVSLKRVILNILFFLSVIGILLVTLLPQIIGAPRVLNLVPFVGMYNILFHSVEITVPIRNLGFNILLFVPFGLFLSIKKSYLRKTLKNVVISGLLFSIMIEILQYAFPMGRSADVDDVILNTIGTLLGYIVWEVLSVRFSGLVMEEQRKMDEHYN